jgi:hypothetical protein
MKKKRPKRSVARATERRRKNYLAEKRGNIEQLRINPQKVPEPFLYDQPMIPIEDKAKPTNTTKSHADKLFDEKIMKAKEFKTRKIAEKKRHWRQILHAAKKAIHADGTIGVVRNMASGSFSKIRLQVVKCAVETGLLWERKSKPGSPKISRLVPTIKLRKYTEVDPWAFDPDRQSQYVFLRNRKNKKEILFDPTKLIPAHVAKMTQERLQLINDINALYRIKYWQYSQEEKKFVGTKQLRPVHSAIFSGSWDLGGRLFTGAYGHQSLTKLERQTINFNDCPSVEKDYGGMHTRMLYHLRTNINYRRDPYKIWGKKTTKEQRKLAKTLINIALNAPTRKIAITAADSALNTYTNEPLKDGNGRIVKNRTGKILYKRKTGDSLQDAIELYDAYQRTGLTFDEVYDLALQKHKPIAQYFGSDAGVWLMRIESSIAIDILYEFAKLAIPCLCCHDSFIVPKDSENLLIQTMVKQYILRFGNTNLPIIK